jgi:hypothetical protein
VLTNSLASNDVLAVHSGYQKYRDDLLENGGGDHELRPDCARQLGPWPLHRSRARGCTPRRWSSIAGTSCRELQPIHAGRYQFGFCVAVDSPAFAEMVAGSSTTGQTENSYRVTLRGTVWWMASDGGRFGCTRRSPRPAGGGASKPMCWASCRFIRYCEAGRPVGAIILESCRTPRSRTLRPLGPLPQLARGALRPAAGLPAG